MAKDNFIDAKKIVDELTEAFKKHQAIISENAVALGKLDKQYSKLPSDYIKAQKELSALNVQRKKEELALNAVMIKKQQLEQALINTQIKENSLIKSTIDLKNKETRERDKNEKALAREAAKLAIVSNIYDKTQRQLNVINKEYDNLSAKKARYNNLTDFEEKRLQTLTKTTQKYDTILKGLDATKGKYTRTVGNYAGAFNPLNNSIGQLARELPNFGQSIQIGIMSITNNVGALQDAVGGIVAQNKILAAEGKATQSVMKQLGASIFSFNVLLYVGIAFLNAYGKEIGEWVSHLFDGVKALDALKDAQKALDTIRISSLKSIVEERIELRNNLKTAKDETVSKEERLIAVKKLQSEYPFYFKNLTQEKILLGETADAEREINLALLARAKSQAAVTKITENQSRVIDLEEEIILQKEALRVAKIPRIMGAAQTEQTDPIEIYNAQRKLNNSLEERNYLNQVNNRLVGYSLTEREKSIGLDYQEEKTTKAKTKSIDELNLELADYLANLYALRKAQMELEAENLDELWKDESQTFIQRTNSYREFIEKKRDIAELDYEEEKRLQEKAYNDAKVQAQKEVTDFVKDGGNKTQARIKYNKFVEALDKEHKLKLEKIELDHSAKVVVITKKTFKDLEEIRIREYTKSKTNAINEQELKDIEEFNKELLNITKSTTIKRIREIEKVKTDATYEANAQRLQLEIQGISERLDLEKEGTEAYLDLYNQMIAKQKELTELNSAEGLKRKDDQIKYLADIKSYLNGFTNDLASQTGLTTLFKVLNKEIVGFGENLQVTLTSSMEIMQEIFSFLEQQSERRYQRDIERLYSQKEIAIKFAGESASAKEEIERQYEERRRAIESQKAKQERRNAIFNIIIDTAQAVVAALPNIPLSIAMGLIGAAQLAVVASAPLPAYAEGTDNHPGGLFLANDGKQTGGKHEEVMQTPDGKTSLIKGRNVLMSAPKGTKVLTHEQWQGKLNDVLASNGISYSGSMSLPEVNIPQNGLTKEDLNAEISRLANVINNKKSFEIVRDSKGERMYEKEQNQRKEILNARLNSKTYGL